MTPENERPEIVAHVNCPRLECEEPITAIWKRRVEHDLSQPFQACPHCLRQIDKAEGLKKPGYWLAKVLPGHVNPATYPNG